MILCLLWAIKLKLEEIACLISDMPEDSKMNTFIIMLLLAGFTQLQQNKWMKSMIDKSEELVILYDVNGLMDVFTRFMEAVKISTQKTS